MPGILSFGLGRSDAAQAVAWDLRRVRGAPHVDLEVLRVLENQRTGADHA